MDSDKGNDAKISVYADAYSEKPDFGANDYGMLPNCGAFHFSLPDAALLLVIDQRGNIKGAPEQEHGEDHRDPIVRKKLEPFIETYLKALVSSVESGTLKAKVLARTLHDSRLVPSRTFVEIDRLCRWAGQHQIEIGDSLDEFAYKLGDVLGWAVERVALDRAAFRSLDGEDVSEDLFENPDDSKDDLRQKLMACHLKISELKRLENGKIAGGPLKSLERTTLLKMVIGMAIAAYKFAPAAARNDATAIISSDLTELGIDMHEDTVRKWLKVAATTVLEGRSQKT